MNKKEERIARKYINTILFRISEYNRFEKAEGQTKEKVRILFSYIKQRKKDHRFKRDESRWKSINKKITNLHLWFLVDHKIFYLFMVNIINSNG
jgi:hypothetical protein